MITIIGATGYTGSLIAKLLTEKKREIRLAGRDAAKLASLESRLGIKESTTTIDLSDETSIDKAIQDSSVVISCAGPFTKFGLPVLKRAMALGVNYLDITGEQHFVARAINDFSEGMKAKEKTGITACAFEYAIADWGASVLEEALGGLDAFEVTYEIDGIHTSRGTKNSVMCALESPSFHLDDGILEPIAAGKVETSGETKRCRFPFPGGEVFLTPLHVNVRTIKTYLSSPLPSALVSLLTHLGPAVSRSPMRPLIDKMITLSQPSPKSPEDTEFKISCVGRFARNQATLEISGKDPYFITAEIAAAAAIFLDDRESETIDSTSHEGSTTESNSHADTISKAQSVSTTRNFGIISASMLDGPDFIRSILEKASCQWTLESERKALWS